MRRPGSGSKAVSTAAVASYGRDRPLSVYVVDPNVDYVVEIHDPTPRRLV